MTPLACPHLPLQSTLFSSTCLCYPIKHCQVLISKLGTLESAILNLFFLNRMIWKSVFPALFSPPAKDHDAHGSKNKCLALSSCFFTSVHSKQPRRQNISSSVTSVLCTSNSQILSQTLKHWQCNAHRDSTSTSQSILLRMCPCLARYGKLLSGSSEDVGNYSCEHHTLRLPCTLANY